MVLKFNFFCIFVFSFLVGESESESSLKNKDTRIIGGTNASPGEFKFIVSLQKPSRSNPNNYRHFCAGTILDAAHILTAAHCVWNKVNGSTFVVVAGITSQDEAETATKFAVKSVNVHPNYISKNRAGPYDIAVLKLNSPLTFGPLIGPVSLPRPAENATGECTSVGWGNTFLLSTLYYRSANTLKKVSSHVISTTTCRLLYLMIFRRPLLTGICTMAGPFRGTCQGDSGGPLICSRADGSTYQAGIVSWGWILCADTVHPDVSTNVSLFTTFIQQQLLL